MCELTYVDEINIFANVNVWQICVFFQMTAELSHFGDHAVNRGYATLNPEDYLHEKEWKW